MTLVYHKLKTINYKSRRFVIFSSQQNWKTFIEIDSNNNYIYPSIDNFMALSKIYNGTGMKNNNKSTGIKITSGILALLLISNGAYKEFINIYNIDLNKLGDSYFVQNLTNPLDETQIVILENPQDFNDILEPKNITKESCVAAINANQNLNSKQKNTALAVLNRVLAINPNMDLRMFYENMSRLQIATMSIEELHEKYHDYGSIANFISSKYLINITYDYEEGTLAHEICHCFNNLCIEKDGVKYYYYCAFGDSLDEAMNSEVANLAFIDNGYKVTRQFLDYLRANVSYSITDYYNYGINDLINKLKSKYPAIDIDSIVTAIDELTQAKNEKNDTIYTDSNLELLNNLFEICKSNCKDNPSYKPFLEFAKVFSRAHEHTIIYDYLEKYNAYLEQLGYENIITAKDLDAVKKIVYCSAGIIYNTEEAALVNKLRDSFGYTYFVAGDTEINPNGKQYYGIEDFKQNQLNMLIIAGAEYYAKDEEINWLSALKASKGLNIFRDISLYLNGEEIARESMYDYVLYIGHGNDGNISYKIKGKAGKTLYSSSNSSERFMYSVSLYYYTDSINKPDINEINIEEYLNDNYLMFYLLKKGPNDNTIFINNNGVLFVPDYVLFIDVDGLYKRQVDLTDEVIKKDQYDRNIIQYTDYLISDIITGLTSPTYRDILLYAGILDDNEKEYTINSDQLIDYIKGYYQDKYGITIDNSLTRRK